VERQQQESQELLDWIMSRKRSAYALQCARIKGVLGAAGT
jgi:hypothetical protein